MQKLIHKFKYSQKTMLRFQLARYMIEFIQQYTLDINQFDMIIPVPLHSTRERERGFNQSLLLAEIIAQEFSIPLEKNILIRAKNTNFQAAQSRKERWTNTYEAFTIKHSHTLAFKSVLVVDDLFTTGATLSESARILKQHSVNKVGVLTLAITS